MYKHNKQTDPVLSKLATGTPYRKLTHLQRWLITSKSEDTSVCPMVLMVRQTLQSVFYLYILTHYRLNRLSHTIYWKTPISILGTSCYEIYIHCISLEKNG